LLISPSKNTLENKSWMYLVKEIVESYNGSTEVKDPELGGARFDVKLNRA